jgi:NB-ARC domain
MDPMDVNEVLQLVDRLVVQKTGKPLNNVQRAVLEGTWQRDTYDEIAQKCHVTEKHLADVGYDLWQILSEALGEDIKKTNFRSTIERIYIKSSPITIQNNHKNTQNYDFNSVLHYLNDRSNQDEQKGEITTEPKLRLQDLILAPQIIHFYRRESELNILENWLFNQQTRLISVLGVSGIGKTTLVKRFVDRTLDRFDAIVWRNLKFPESLPSLVNDLLKVCQQEPKGTISDRLKQLFALFTEKRCLIILDDVQNLFSSGTLVGEYQTEYQDYQKFFSAIADLENKSRVILISQEQCGEMQCLDDELYPIKFLELSGLEDGEILKITGLKDEETWLSLIKLYQGNPGYLKNIAILIKNIFDGHVADFLAENTLVVPKEMQFSFNQLFQRLSPIEQQIVLELSQFDQPVTREELMEVLHLSSMDLINGLQSLQQRYLVTKIRENRVLFKLSPVFREYVRIRINPMS